MDEQPKKSGSFGISNKRMRLLVLLVICLIIVSGAAYTIYNLTSYKHISLNATDEELGITERPSAIPASSADSDGEASAAPPETVDVNGKIFNIALFGLDRRTEQEASRSDSMMVLTLDFGRHKTKLTSLMRDLYVPIEGHNSSKLNHAYAFGGAKLAIKTINKNFGTDIRDYIAVDFYSFEKVIDSIGGIPLEVHPEDIEIINSYISETAAIEKKDPKYVERAGLQILNGMQAVAYSRNRYAGNGDFERTERQRKVLIAIEQAAREKGAFAILSLLKELMPNIETSLDRSEILSMAYQYLKVDMEVEQMRFPLDNAWKEGRTADGEWIIDADIKRLREQVQQYIFNDVDPQ